MANKPFEIKINNKKSINPKSLANLKNAVKFQKGQIPWNKDKKGVYKLWPNGRIFSQETKEKIRATLKQKGIQPPKYTQFKKGHSMAGEKHPMWKGGITGKFLLDKREKAVGRKKPEHCELCGLVGRICYDHDHKTEKFRGWICHRCNVVLGMAGDDVKLLLAMVNYLNKSNE